MSDQFYPASYGGVRLWIGRISTANGRTVIVHQLSRGDAHPVDDRGLVPRIATAELLFDDMSGETQTPRERFDAFRQLVEGGGSHVFVHPLIGSYRARIANLEHTLEELTITASCSIIPADEIPAVSGVTLGTSGVAGEHNVQSAADTFNAAIADVGLESDIGAQSIAATEAWSEGASARDVLVDVASLSDSIRVFIEVNRLAEYIAYWSTLRAAVLLGDSIARAGRAATSAAPKTFTMLIRTPVALRKLLAEVYGAHEVELRVPQVMSLNDIRTPGWIAVGTELVLPQAPSVARAQALGRCR